MTRQVIGVGTFPNDATGDPLQTAFNKTNANFNELYGLVQISLQPQPQTPAELSAGIVPINLSFPPNNVLRYGAIGNGTADDTAAFNSAIAVAQFSKEMYLPPRPSGQYYKITSTLVFTSQHNSMVLYGAGNTSIIVVATTAGADGIQLQGVQHATIRDLGIYGTTLAGNLLNLMQAGGVGNGTNYLKMSRVWMGWGGTGGTYGLLKITAAQSNTFTDCDWDSNNGYRPATLSGGLLDGLPSYGVWITGSPTGINNDNTFLNCRVNAAGGTYNLYIDNGGGLGQTNQNFKWLGGLIQGANAPAGKSDISITNCQNAQISSHIEPVSGAATVYDVIMIGCQSCTIKDCVVQGDIEFITNCLQCGTEDVIGAGYNFDATQVGCFIQRGSYGSILTGPAGGVIKDPTGKVLVNDVTNTSNVLFSYGYWQDATPSEYFKSNMQEWEYTSGGVLQNPCGLGLLAVGGFNPTITRSTTQVFQGTYSAQVQANNSQVGQSLAISIAPANLAAGRAITVEAWVYNAGAIGDAQLFINENSGGSVYGVASQFLNQWERLVYTFFPHASATTSILLQVRCSNSAANFYLGSFKVWLGQNTPINDMALANSATPGVSYPSGGFGGYPVAEVDLQSTTITYFLSSHVGKPFIGRATGAITINNSATLALKGGVNATLAAGNTITFLPGVDGVIRETARNF